MRFVKSFSGWKWGFGAAISIAGLMGMVLGDFEKVDLSGPRIVGENVFFTFRSATNEILTLQSAASILGQWQDLTNRAGTGAEVEFSTPFRDEGRFFRMKRTPITPAPELPAESLMLKAGESVEVKLQAIGGTEPFSWFVDGVLPAGLSLSEDGVLSGTPTADAAEHNENGRYANRIIVQDSFTDPFTGRTAARRATNTINTLVRLSYLLNIRATRPNGPSLQHNCSICHSADFKPDVTSDATALINVLSGSGAECGTDRPYISPPDASDSLLYEKLTSRSDCGERMPFDGEYFSDRQLNRLARWIRELTPDDQD